MKFGKFFARNSLQQEQINGRSYVPYEQLKQLIQKRNIGERDIYNRFVTTLDASAAEIDLYYQTKLGEFQRTAKSAASQHLSSVQTTDKTLLKNLYEQCNDLAQDLSALKFYTTLNQVAMKKICKKFDKRIHSRMDDSTLLPMSLRYVKKMRQLQFCDHTSFHRFSSSVSALMNDIERSMARNGMSPLQYKNKIDEDTMKQLSGMIHGNSNTRETSTSSKLAAFLFVPLVLMLLAYSVQFMSLSTMLIALAITVPLSIILLVRKFKQASPIAGTAMEDDPNVQYINPLTVSQLFFLIPTNIISRVWGIAHSVKLPVFARKPLFMLWTIVFGVNLDEMRHPLESYESLGDFFSRPLKDNVRLIDREVETPDTFVFSSPVDGRVVSMGEVNVDETTGEATLEQIKGLSYSLNEFLGKSRAELLADIRQNGSGQKKRLYQIVVYLAPGDYHRIHSPIDWKINRRTHFPGCLLPVNPIWVKFVRGLFAMNERVVLEGEYTRTPANNATEDEDGDFARLQSKDKFYMVAVGALNVGSIALTFDTEVKTNSRWQLPIKNSCPTVQKKIRYMNKKICKHYLDLEEPYGVGTAYDRIYPDGISIEVGEELALFQLGSTIALIFEMDDDEDLYAEVAVGDKVRVGQKLFTSRKNE